LREKLVAQDNGLDDRLVELLKVFLVYEHPFLLQRPRLRLFLDHVTEDDFNFIALFDHSKDIFQIKLPRSLSDDLLDRKEELVDWVKRNHTHSNIFNLSQNDDSWINMWRWSPQTWAMKYLSNFVQEIKSGLTIDTNSKEFKNMIDYLPRGAHLPSQAKRELRTIFEYIKQHGPPELEDRLFEIRFNIELEDDWYYNNDPDDIDTLWKLLRDLPDTNIEGNSFIREILLEAGEGGGWYNPTTYDIGIGELELLDQEAFEDVVRHEIGHSVHQKHEAKVDQWLKDQFGWQMLEPTNKGIDNWVS
jgi:hypothetical protein